MIKEIHEFSITNVLNESSLYLLPILATLLGYFRTVPIPELLKRKEEYERKINQYKYTKFLIREDEFRKVIDKTREIHNQLIVINVLQLLLSALACLIISRFFVNDNPEIIKIVDDYIKLILLIIVSILLLFHLYINSKYIYRSVKALIEISSLKTDD